MDYSSSSSRLISTLYKYLFVNDLLRCGTQHRNYETLRVATQGPLLACRGGKGQQGGAMNTPWRRQVLLGTRGTPAALVPLGLALVGLVVVLLVIARGKTLFADEQASRPATIGSIQYDGAVSVYEGAQDADGEKSRAVASYVP